MGMSAADAEKAVKVYCAENGLTIGRLAERLRISAPHLSAAIHEADTFCLTRYRWRLEAAIGKRLWTSDAEADELAALGERLGLNLVTASPRAIRTALRAASGGGEDMVKLRGGFPVLRAGLLWMNPESVVARRLGYR